MAAHKGPASLRPRCTRRGSSVAVIPIYQCPPSPGGRLPSSQIEPSSEVRKTCALIMVLSVEDRCTENFLITLYTKRAMRRYGAKQQTH
jgi:hypothetical protein